MDTEYAASSVVSAKRRAESELHRLKLDLALSSATVWSESLDKSKNRDKTPVPAPADADDLFGQLSLEERPAVVEFRLLQPRPDHRDLPPPIPLDVTQSLPLLDEWVIGDSVANYRWNVAQISLDSLSHNPSGRPIRPLPSARANSPRPAPNGTQSQPFSSVPVVLSLPPVPAVLPAPQPKPRQSALPAMARSSPPPEDSQSQSQSQSLSVFPQTQTERGPFGARPEASKGARKKAAKKRQGGF
jgi:hypothetical protein